MHQLTSSNRAFISDKVKPRQIAWVLLLFVLISALPSIATNDSIPVVVVSHVNEGYEVSGSFEVVAPLEVVWETLSDYESIPKYVESMKVSKWVSLDASVYLYQEWQTSVLFYTHSSSLNLIIEEIPQQIIRFEGTPSPTFKNYVGYWLIEQNKGSVLVNYFLQTNPQNLLFEFMVRGILSGSISNMLGEVKAEVERRISK